MRTPALRIGGATLSMVVLAAGAILTARGVSGQETRYAKHAEPAFASVPPESLPKSIHVTPGRSEGFVGYNRPILLVELPAADNSEYAVVEFADTRPVDGAGNPVPHEVELGGYNARTHKYTIRFNTPDGNGLVSAARAVGRVSVKYPVAIRTTSVKAGSPESARLGITVDGPVVSYRPEALSLPNPISFDGIEPFRAYDAAGRQLERGGTSTSSTVDGVRTQTLGFGGPVASVRFDAVEKWSQVEVPFDVKAAPLRPPQ